MSMGGCQWVGVKLVRVHQGSSTSFLGSTFKVLSTLSSLVRFWTSARTAGPLPPVGPDTTVRV